MDCGILLAEIERLRGNLTLAEEGLASAMQEIAHLQAYQRQMNDILKANEQLAQERDDYKADYLRIHRQLVDLKYPGTVPPAEPSADYGVKCECGWQGPVSELVKLGGKHQCPACWAEFIALPARFVRRMQLGEHLDTLSPKELVEYAIPVFPDPTQDQETVLGKLFSRILPGWENEPIAGEEAPPVKASVPDPTCPRCGWYLETPALKSINALPLIPAQGDAAARAGAESTAEGSTRHFDQQSAEWHCLCGEPLPTADADCPKCTPSKSSPAELVGALQ